jgi:hypothetical protein
MANFRIRVGFNRGRGPVSFKHLSVLTDEINLFLRRLGEDAGLSDSANQWLATKVEDGSFLSDAEPDVEVSQEAADHLGRMMSAIVSGDSIVAQELGVSERTRLRFADVAKRAESTHVPVELGLYSSLAIDKKPAWHRVTVEKAQSLTLTVAPFVDYMGALQGVVHAWFKESGEPHFQLRELGQNQLVNCYYRGEQYADVLRAVVHRQERVHVSGLVRVNRADKSIESIRVSKIKNAVEFSDAEFERFFGCAPAMTGDLDSAEFVSQHLGYDA